LFSFQVQDLQAKGPAYAKKYDGSKNVTPCP
jgi:hypothetical protein